MKPAWYDRRVIVVNNDKDREAIAHVQLVLGLEPTGEITESFNSSLRGIQALFMLPVTGILDDATAEQIERIYPYGA